jgi:hypothetical protein
MDDPRPTVISSIDCKSSNIIYNTEDPVVLLFGGKVAPPKEKPDDPDPPYKSMRDAIHRRCDSFDAYYPENIGDWLHDSTYKNLIDFESDLAAICSLVVIVSESSGSIAELSFFSQHAIAHKTLVFSTAKHSSESSFINLGIFRYLSDVRMSKKRLPAVKSYPWEINSASSITLDMLNDIIKDIEEEIQHLPKKHQLDQSETTHLIAAIYQVTNIFIALKITEIQTYLEMLEFKFTLGQLKARLFLMQKFRIIEKLQYSDAEYFVIGKNSYHHMTLSTKYSDNKTSKPLDYIRIKMDCMKYYSGNDSERHRNGLLKKHRHLVGGKF